MTTLYLVRHGETPDNVNMIMQGQTQGMLNENGKRQARELAMRMKDKHLDAILSSDLRRAIETAEIIADGRELNVETTPLLRERDWGGFTGKYIPSIQNAVWPNDIEGLEELRGRASRFLDLIRERYADKSVLAVGHGIINKAIQSVYFGRAMNEIVKMSNAEIRVLTV